MFDPEHISIAIARAIVEKHRGQLIFAGDGKGAEPGGFEISLQLPCVEEVEE
jgi:signal transduction histidine kinase